MDIAKNKTQPLGEDPRVLLAVQTLLETKGPDIMDPHGNTLLSFAARNGHFNVVKVLVEKYRVPLNVQNFDGETALSGAVLNGRYEVAKLLIDAGANLNVSNVRCEVVLHQAAGLGNCDMARLIVEEGGYLNAEDEWGDTPLHFAVREDRVDVVEYLLSVGADLDYLNQDEESPSELAEMVGSLPIKNAFATHRRCSNNMDLQSSLETTSFLKSPLLLQKSTKKLRNSTVESISLALSNSHNALWQGDNSTSSLKRYTPNSRLRDREALD